MAENTTLGSGAAVRRVVVFLPSLAGGGAERVTLALAEGLARGGLDVRLVVGTSAGELADAVPAGLDLQDLHAARTLFAGVGLWRLLRRDRPDVVVSAISHANVVAAVVARLLPHRPRLIVMHHNTTSISTRRTVRRRDRLIPVLCGLAYRLADAVTAVSHGVAADLAESSHLPSERIRILPNPIEYERLRELATQPAPTADRLRADTLPVVVAAGRLQTQKAFDVLLDAAARMTTAHRLVILGDGPLRPALEQQARDLGLADRVTFTGFVANPYPFFAAADVFALSSRWEGLPTVLLESLAFPLRIVATDCPSGPAEILDGVDGSELVPVQDAPALAVALDRALAAGPLTRPREQWRRYDVEPVMTQIRALVAEVGSAR